jgi:regulator of replication initiation timing
MPSADAQVSVDDPDSARAEEASSARPSELDRLEQAVRELVEQRAALGAENDLLRGDLDQASITTRDLEERLLAETQRRQDAVKRIDDLVGLIQQLEPSLAAKTGS